MYEIKDPVSIIEQLFPGRKWNRSSNNPVIKAGDLMNRPGGSFSINHQGLWIDYATGQKGNLISLLQIRYNLSFKQVIESLETNQELAPSSEHNTPKRPIPLMEKVRKLESTDIPPPPVPGMTDYLYQQADGKYILAIRVYRDPETQLKKPMRWSWNGISWQPGNTTGAESYPLYRLPELLQLPPESYIILAEGEKAAESFRNGPNAKALQSQFSAATTALGGANPVWRTDWSPLQDKNIVILPDNDPAGYNFLRRCQEILSSHQVKFRWLMPEQVWRDLLKAEGECPLKWDIADPVQQSTQGGV